MKMPICYSTETRIDMYLSHVSKYDSSLQRTFYRCLMLDAEEADVLTGAAPSPSSYQLTVEQMFLMQTQALQTIG